jgi:two-component system clock-associated histidine kinase SasA
MGVQGQFPVAEQTINMSLVSADKLMTIIESLLTIQKGRSMTLDRTSVSIEELIELARWTLLSSIEKANLKLTVEIPRDTPLVYVDSEKVRRVIINLLDNAIRYTPSGDEIRLWVEEDRARRKLIVHLADSGPGIPVKERERVFEQFWQVKGNQPLRGTKGNGIGLAFVARVLEAHGESIQVEETSPLPGAHFSFTLPAARQAGDTGPLD